jgi:glycine cleavage system H protein
VTDFVEITVDKFIFKAAVDRLYSRDGVWVLEESGPVRLGITDYEQQRNGDAAFVHVKPAGTKLKPGDEWAEIETIKATVSFASPLAGTIVETNGLLASSPEIVNQEPYGSGWMAVIEPADWSESRKTLLEAAAYQAMVKTQAEQELQA